MTIKVVFLDIDGVLLPGDRLWSGEKTVCPGRLKLLNDMLLETGAYVVISSTWRLLGKCTDFVKLLVSLHPDWTTTKDYPSKEYLLEVGKFNSGLMLILK